MIVSRRTALKLGLGAGAVPLLNRIPLQAAQVGQSPGEDPREDPRVRAFEDEMLQARRLPLDAVRLQPGGPLKHAQELDEKYLLELEPDRMLAYFRERAGLKPKAEPYGGWDGGGRNLTGHVCGHYLSAVSLMYAATGDDRFKQRVDYIVDELKVVQDKNGDGYLVALEGGRDCFNRLAKGDIKAAAFDLNGQWSPWYTLHKLYAGLRDAYRFTGNKTALDVEIAFAGWAEGILSGLSDDQLQEMMLTEFGGMNEVLVDLYADTDDERWLDLSYSFEHKAFIDPLQRHQDDLGGKHGNTAIPKLIGSVDRFAYTGRAADLMAASYFFDIVDQHHSFTSGGHGQDEYFGPPDVISAISDGRTAESCNVYNMLKLTRRLFTIDPDVHYADFHERALFNHVMASIDPNDGRMCYMVPVGRGVTHEYQDMLHAFTCCVCSGMENHALHGDGLYYEDGDNLWVNLYVPSTAEWADAGVKLAMATDFPVGESAKLTLDMAAPKEFTLRMRRPYWAGDGFRIEVNGQPVEAPPVNDGKGEMRRGSYYYPYPLSSYVEVRRTWKSGDVVEVTLPKSLHLEVTPDNPNRASLMWGPLVLAGDIGPEPQRGRGPQAGPRPEPPIVPVFVALEKPLEEWLQPITGKPGHFRTAGVGYEPTAEGAAHEVELMPFYELHERTYATYWDMYTPEQWTKEKAEYRAEAKRMAMLDAASVASVPVGDFRAERAFDYQGGDDARRPVRIMDRTGRAARSWFSYEVPVDPTHPMALMVTYFSDDTRNMPASFQIQVDGTKVADANVVTSEPRRFYDVTYPIPAELVKGKEKVTVRFQANEGSRIATVFGIRMVKEDEVK